MFRKAIIGSAVIVITYVSSYFLLVQEGFWFGMGGCSIAYPTYRFCLLGCRSVEVIFSPLHKLDRKILRPTKWETRDCSQEAPIVFTNSYNLDL